jgi:hypothetical protein
MPPSRNGRHREASVVNLTAPPLLSPTDVVTLGRILEWLRGYIAQPDPRLGRPGPLCPFVGPAVDADAILLCVAAGVTDPLAPECRLMVRALADRLLDDRDTVATAAKAIVLALPGVEPDATPALDTLHGLVKDELMADGLLLGQFHDRCEVPAARNARFAVQTSAVPLLVLRPLTLHDVLFLHTDPDRFGVFRARYAELFDSGRVKDPLLLRAWAAGLSNSRVD